MNINRKDFLAATAFAVSATPLVSQARRKQRNMCGYGAPAMEKVKVGIIGLGMRGSGAVERLSKIKDVEIEALCDLREQKVKKAQKALEKNNRKPAKEFYGSQNAWKKLVDLDLDLIYIVTPWDLHAPMCVYSMKHGKHAATEVPAALTIEECFELVETSEKTGKHCMMLENCCYDFFEMQTLNMVRQGVFGELTHAEGAYIHNLCGLLAKKNNGYEDMWRFEMNKKYNGNLYPTHGVGPVSQCMNINRGNQYSHLVSMQSQEAAFTEWAATNNQEELANLKKYRGDMNTTLIKCELGQTIMVQHDVSTPRPYSRIHLLQGEKGIARKWPKRQIAIGHNWLNEEQMKEMAEKYKHPLCKTIGDIARKVGGHGGMDFIMDYRLIYSLKNGLPLDQDVYDAAAWSSIIPLSLSSVENKSRTVDVPDFTKGKWKTNKPLGIVDVNPTLLPVVGM